MKQLLFLLFGVFLFTSCCKKDKDNDTTPVDVLPPITQEGKNTFGCLVDGKVWIPKASFPNSSLTSSYQSNVFLLSAYRNIDSTSYSINYSGYFFQQGNYHFDNILHGMTYTINSPSQFSIFNTDSSFNGNISILKLDTVNGIIAATFYFDAIDTVTNEIVHITEGRFDVKY